MSNWQRTIKLGDVWEFEDIPLIARTITDRLCALPRLFSNEQVESLRQELISEFSVLAEDEDAGKDEFNSAMTMLYDWGDMSIDSAIGRKKVCWIDVQTKP